MDTKAQAVQFNGINIASTYCSALACGTAVVDSNCKDGGSYGGKQSLFYMHWSCDVGGCGIVGSFISTFA